MFSLRARPLRRAVPVAVAAFAGAATIVGTVGIPEASAGGPTPSTLSVSPGTVVPHSTGNTLTFTYTSGNNVSPGTLTIPMPNGFSAPSGVTSSALNNCSSATPSTSHRKIVVAFSCAPGGSFDLTAPNETAPRTPGTYTFNASTTGAPITAEPSIDVTGAGPTAKLTISSLPSAVDSDVAFSFTVTAYDAFGNVTPAYAGTVKFASTDPRATLPGAYTFNSTDAGSHTFSGVMLYSPGRQTIDVVDQVNLVSGAKKTLVAGPTGITVSPSSPSIVRGTTQSFSASVSYADGTNVSPDAFVIWSTDTPTVATIDKTGVATGAGTGSATISATLANAVGQTTLSVTPSTTTTVLSSSSNPSVSSQSVTFTATVTPNGAPGSATGTVTFSDNGTTIDTETLSAGMASFTTSFLSVGTHPIVASYGGDTNNQASNSDTLNQVVNTEGTVTSLTSDSPGGSTYGQAVTFTATVTLQPGGVTAPNGFVAFTDSNGDILASVPVSNGTAAFTTSNVADPEDSILPVGNDTITASFTPTNSDQATSTGSFVQTVSPAPTTLDASSNGPTTFGTTASLSVTITPDPAATNAAAATGTIIVTDSGNNVVGAATVSGPTTTVNLSSALPVGDNSLTVFYSGDGNYGGSSTSVTQTVN